MIETGTEYQDQAFRGVELDQARLISNRFQDCTFDRSSFSETLFQNCRFTNCRFLHCDLSLIQVPGSVFAGTHFDSSKLIGVNWTLADWSAARLGDPLAFTDCALNHSTFIGLGLNRIQIRDCTAVNVDFRECDLSRADFSGTDLSECLFHETDLTGADLSAARNYQIDPVRNQVTQARFSLPEAMSLLFNLDIVLIESDHQEAHQ